MDNQVMTNLNQLDHHEILLQEPIKREGTRFFRTSSEATNSFKSSNTVISSDGSDSSRPIQPIEKGKLNLNRLVIVKQFAPKVFHEIRKLNNVTDEDVIKSLDPSKNIKNIQNAGEGAGASGSFFFFSSDKRFILKTMSRREINQLIRILP